MNASKHLAALALSLALAACSSSDPKSLIDDGQKALNSGQAKAALAKYEEALAALKPADPLYFEAKLGIVLARIESDPERARTDFQALAKELPDKVTEKEYLFVSGQMVSARKFADAAYVAHDGIQRAGGDCPALMARIDVIKKEAVNDKHAADALKGLGYTN